MAKMMCLLVWMVTVIILNAGAQPIRLPAIIGDNMVLQRNIKAPVWGWASPNEKISITFKNKTYTTTAAKDGKWLLKLDAARPGGPCKMTIKEKDSVIMINNILVGDVWLASGQSNMELGIQADSRGADAIAGATDSLIRFFYVPMSSSLQPKDDIAPVPTASLNGKWVVCSPDLLVKNWAWHGFSAVGYYFARAIRKVTGSPVGMIGSYKGGTPAQAWVSGTGERYNAMITPLIPYAIKGVIWYQGESNGDRIADARQYSLLFPRLITDWRQQWLEGNFPFLFVQLPNFRAPAKSASEGIWPWVREAQLKTLDLPNTGMAVTTDIGEAGDIHPKNKLDVGARLALAARHIAYHENIVYAGPVYKTMTITGNKIRLTFTNSDNGLMSGAPPGAAPAETMELKGFGIAGADKRFVWAKAVIEGATIVVYSDEVTQPVAVRYNWADNPPGNLYNKAGLPASPFRTDNWQDETK